jgi:hypothetical protein
MGKGYIPDYQKKIRRLARRKRDLIRLLEGQATEGEVALAAEEVRASRIRVLQAKRAQVPPSEANAYRFRALDKAIRSCREQSIAEIIASCRG